jgi:hypothetical protein
VIVKYRNGHSLGVFEDKEIDRGCLRIRRKLRVFENNEIEGV